MKRSIERVEVSLNDFQIDYTALPPEDPPTLSESILTNEIPLDLRDAAIQKYHYFRTNYSRVSPRKGGNFVIRQPLGPDAIYLDEIHASIISVIKSLSPFGVRLNLSFALFLENRDETDPSLKFSLAYASNNFQLFESARFITSQDDVQKLLDLCSYTAISDHIDMSLSSTKVRVAHIAAVLVNAIILPDAIQFGATSFPIPKFLKSHSIYVPPTANGFCLFYCLEDFFNGVKLSKSSFDVFIKAKGLARRYCAKVGKDFSNFNGSVTIDDFPNVESTFGVNILVFDMSVPDPNTNKGLADLKYISKRRKFDKWIYLNSFNGHLCHIRNIRNFMANYRCPRCYKNFTRLDYLKHHVKLYAEKDCLVSSPVYSKSYGFRPARTLEQDLHRVGISIPEGGLKLDLLGTWDCETILIEPQAKNSKKRTILGRHSVICISIASNVPGFKAPKVFIDFNYEFELVSKFLDYARLMSEQAFKINLERHAPILEKLDKLLEDTSEGSFEKSVIRVKHRLMKALRRLRLYSCWGAKFDTPLILALILTYHHRKREPFPNVVKSGGKFILLEDEYISLRDIASIQATSLDAFITCWGEQPAKLVFPFDLMKSQDFLNYVGPFPSREAMANKLKAGELPSESIYARSKYAYESVCQSRMDLYFVHYAKVDVEPAVSAISNMLFYFYDQFKINFLVDGLTISSIAISAMFSMMTPRGTFIMAPSKPSEEFNDKLRKNICGGYSAIHSNAAIAGMTRIWDTDDSPIHRKVIGWDANMLYSGILSGTLPTGIPLTWKLERGNFVRQKSLLHQSSFAEMQYCIYMESITDSDCHHAFNGDQDTFGPRQYKPDIFIPAEKRVILFNGCYFHMHGNYDHRCPLSRPEELTPARAKKINNDKEAIKYYEERGLHTEIMWECSWDRLKNETPQIRDFLEKNIDLPYQSTYRIPEAKMRQLIMSKTMYGFVEFTAHIDDDHAEFYRNNLAPFIQKFQVHPSTLSPLQQKLCRHSNIKKPRTQLIAATKSAPNTLVSTDLFIFLANLPGFTLDSIKSVIQFKPGKPFERYINKLVAMRQAADKDPKLGPLGTVSKLLGNASFGRTLIDRSRYVTTEFITEREYYKTATNPWLQTANPLVPSGFWEIARRKLTYSTYSCPVIGATCLFNSKIVLLRFVYHMLRCFNCERNQIRLLSLDTDSAYFSTPTEDLDTILPESQAQVFHRLKPDFFALHESQHRQPLLFKIEKTADHFVGLSPKNYICFDITSMEELKRFKTTLEKLHLYAGPSDLSQLSHLIRDKPNTKLAMKGIPKSTAQKFTGIDFLRTFLIREPTYAEFHAIQRAVTTKEIVTLRQTRVALSRLSFKLKQPKINSTQALF